MLAFVSMTHSIATLPAAFLTAMGNTFLVHIHADMFSAGHKGVPPLERSSKHSNPTPQGAPFHIASVNRTLGFTTRIDPTNFWFGRDGLTYRWKPKTAASTRRIPLSDALISDLKVRRLTSTNPLIFPASNGGIEGHFLRMFQKPGKLADVSRVKCHRFRDTYVTDQLRAGIDLLTMAKWAGHENLETIKLYADALRDLDDAARAAANRQERYTLGPQLVKTA